MKTMRGTDLMKRNLWLHGLAMLAGLLVPLTARASGPVPEFRVSLLGIQEAAATDVVRATLEQTFQSDFRQGQGNSGNGWSNNNTNTWHYELFYTHRFILNDQWQLRLGVDVDRRDFGDNRSIAPNDIQSYAGVIALDYYPTKQSRIFIESHPGLYAAHELDVEMFDAPTIIGGVFPLVDDKLYVAAGVSLSLLRSYPVLPIGGIIWHISHDWDLEACLPNPRLYYKATDTLQFWTGGELTGTAARMDPSNNPILNHSTVTYYEIRAGAGFIFTGWKGMAVDFGAGWSFERKFDLHRIPALAATDGAPYARLVVSFAF
jgi:hypothetical protein